MAKKFAYEIIKNYIKEKGCNLITSEYEFEKLRETFKTLDKFELEIICSCGNIFKCSFSRFKNANKITCNECAIKLRSSKKRKSTKTIKDIIANDGSGCILLDDEYKNTKTKMNFKCSCGEIFSTSWENYYYRNVRTCEKCRIKHRKDNPNQKWDYNKVVQYVKDFGNGSTLISKRYKNQNELLTFKCKCGRMFETSLSNFIKANQKQCSKCGHERGIEKQRWTIKDIKKYLKDNKFNCTLASKKYINAKEPLVFKCECGNTFSRSWDTFRRYGVDTCRECNCSKGEKRIINFLNNNNITKIKEYTFEDLHSDYGNLLRFDFALFSDNLIYLIEYDGEYHYEPINGEEALERQQYHDKLKNEYCIKNNIALIRIPYWDFDKIEFILTDILINNNVKNIYIVNNKI